MNLAPYRPGVDGPFGFEEAAHLLRRSGFASPAAEVEEVARSGLAAALERIFTDDEGRAARAVAAASPAVLVRDSLVELQGLWLARMVATRSPLFEKLALFWHGHFATSFAKIRRSAWMWRQYELFRRAGGGSFRELLLEVSRDPAMLVWLDGNSNEKGRPNENYAREILELFSLGLGSYGERDVQEAARAFSGWHVKNDGFWFNARAHDDRDKEILGRRGALDGGDVVDLCAASRACPRFLAGKLLRFYVTAQPRTEWVEELAGALVESDLAILPALRRLFASRIFFAPEARGALIASPIELCVGTLRSLRARASFTAVASAAAAMGQALFAPPNVKGWDGDRAWISSLTLLERARFASAVAWGDGGLGVTVEWGRLASGSDRDDPVRAVESVARALVQRPLPQETGERLARFARSDEAGRGEARLRSVAHLVLSAPEAQLT